MKRTSLSRNPVVVIAAVLLACGAAAARGAATYTTATDRLTLPAVAIGGATYSDVVVTVGTIVSGPEGTSADGTVDTYDPDTAQLTVQSVTVGSATYYNVVVTVSSLVSIGGVSGADTYDGTHLTIPSVQLVGGATYTDVVVTVGSVISTGGGMPASVRDLYNAGSRQLTIAAIEVGGHVYTNAVVTLGKLVSVGNPRSSSACYDPVYYATGTVSDVFYQVTNKGTMVETLEEQNVVLPTTTFNGVANAVQIQTTNLVNGSPHSVITEYFDVQSQFPTLLELGQSDGVSFTPGIRIFGAVEPGQSLVSSGTVEPAGVPYTATWTFQGFEDVTVPAGSFAGSCKWTLVENLGSGATSATSWYTRHGVLIQTEAGTGIELQLAPNSTFNGSPVGP